LHRQKTISFYKMTIEVLKSKIHNVTVTGADMNYVGSVTIDEDLMDAAGLFEHEKVHVLDRNNGERLVTYVIKGRRGSGEICLNGPAARKIAVGDVVIIMAFANITPEEAGTFRPKIVFPDTATNKII